MTPFSMSLSDIQDHLKWMGKNGGMGTVPLNGVQGKDHGGRASVKLLELGVRTPWGLFWGVRYAGSVDFRHFRTPSLPIFGVILGLLETTKM